MGLSPLAVGFMAATSMNRAGNLIDPNTRAMVTSPLSSGWRSASMMSAANSGNSSRNSAPV